MEEEYAGGAGNRADPSSWWLNDVGRLPSMVGRAISGAPMESDRANDASAARAASVRAAFWRKTEDQ